MSAHQNPVLALRRAIAPGPGQTAALAVEHAAELARLQGYGLTPQAGCQLHETSLGDATVWIEYEQTPAVGDGWNEPYHDASVSIVGVLVNGQMIDSAEMPKRTIERWEQEILDGAVTAADDAQAEAAERRRDEMEAA